MLNRWTQAAVVATVALSGFGCVSQTAHDQLSEAYRRSEEQIVDLRSRLEESQARIEALQSAGNTPPAELVSRLEQLQRERDAAQAALAEAESRIRELATVQGPLPAELDAALARLAAQHPEIMSYDAKLGMVKFRSDFTFALGSDQVKEAAQSTLGQLAAVIRSPAANGYECRIVGHTDNVPIKNVGTRAKHPTNWHLSVHRSIAVKDVLQKAGVPPVRMSVAGYGEYHPVAPNGPKGAEANRRVEIFLVRKPGAGDFADGPAGSPAIDKGGASAAAPAGENPARFK